MLTSKVMREVKRVMLTMNYLFEEKKTLGLENNFQIIKIVGNSSREGQSHYSLKMN